MLTAGGDCPGLNAGIVEAFAVIAATGAEPVGIADGYSGLVDGGRTVPLDRYDPAVVHRAGGSILGASRTNLSNPDLFAAALAGIETLRLDGVVMYGGDGSLTSAAALADAGVPVGAAPKTIDNDVAGTDTTIGFATAVDTAVAAVDRIRDTATTHRHGFLVEVMGRRSGILAAAVAEACRADGLVVPETPWTIDRVLDTARRPGAIVIVAEGARPQRHHGHRSKVGGVAADIAAADPARPVRVVDLGHVLRGGAPNSTDRLLARRMTAITAAAATAGRSVFAAERAGQVTAVPIGDAAAGRRFLHPDTLERLHTLLTG